MRPNTQAEFALYAQRVEAELNNRWSGKSLFLRLDEDALGQKRVRNGAVLIQASVTPNPRSISDGLIHDWYGAVYIPNSKLAHVLSVLQDFGHHAAIYAPVVRSRLIERIGNDITGYWRIQQKGQLLPAVFDVIQTVCYTRIAPDKWTVESHANDIRAVEDAGSKKEKVLPPGEGIGLIWKLYSYWSLQQVDTGVMAECRNGIAIARRSRRSGLGDPSLNKHRASRFHEFHASEHPKSLRRIA